MVTGRENSKRTNNIIAPDEYNDIVVAVEDLTTQVVPDNLYEVLRDLKSQNMWAEFKLKEVTC